MNRPAFTLRFLATCLAVSTVTCAGCGTFSFQREAQIDGPPPATFTIQTRAAGRKPKQKQLVLQKDMRLQDAVKASGTRFRNKDVYIVRASPKTGENHKLGAAYDVDKRQITLETDYAIHPGDLVVIAEDTTHTLDKVLSGVLGR